MKRTIRTIRTTRPTVSQRLIHMTVGAIAALACANAMAQVITVDGAWVRATVTGQSASGAFMSIKSDTALKLVGATSPVAGMANVHEMSMDGNVMRMRAMPALDLPAGKTVELKPGSYHVMLMDLKQTLTPGSKVPLTLKFEGADKKIVEQTVTAEVRK